MPYHSPYGDHRHDGWDHHGAGHGHDHDGDHHHHGFYGGYGWVGYPYWAWAWGYPYVPGYWDFWDDNNDQAVSGQAASQYPEYVPDPYAGYPAQPAGPEAPENTPSQYSNPATSPTQPASESPAPPESPVTLVFKDGRPNEQIHNYLLTSRTLMVLDQPRREIPVDQLDLSATRRVNRAAGVPFSLPGAGS